MSNREKPNSEAEAVTGNQDRMPEAKSKASQLFFVKIDLWNGSLIKDIRYYSALLSHLRDKKREGMIHNPSLYRTPARAIYERGTDGKGNISYVKKGGSPYSLIKTLPPGTACSRDLLSASFGWEKGNPRPDFYDAYDEALSILQFSLECHEFAQQLLKKKPHVCRWISSRKVQEKDGSIAEIQVATRNSEGLETACFGLFFDTFATPELKSRCAATKNVSVFEQCLAPLKKNLAHALGTSPNL